MTPAIIKQFVTMYDNTIIVLRQAMMFASRSVDPAFSPKALAHNLHVNERLNLHISVSLQQPLI